MKSVDQPCTTELLETDFGNSPIDYVDVGIVLPKKRIDAVFDKNIPILIHKEPLFKYNTQSFSYRIWLLESGDFYKLKGLVYYMALEHLFAEKAYGKAEKFAKDYKLPIEDIIGCTEDEFIEEFKHNIKRRKKTTVIYTDSAIRMPIDIIFPKNTLFFSYEGFCKFSTEDAKKFFYMLGFTRCAQALGSLDASKSISDVEELERILE